MKWSVGLIAGVVLAGCGAPGSSLRATGPSTTIAASVVVPWAPVPAEVENLPQPPPTTAPPVGAPGCTASQVSVTTDGGNGAGGHSITFWRFTNRSPTTCFLGGYPNVAATELGDAPVAAAEGTFFGAGGPPGDVDPGGWSELGLETDSICAAYPGGTDAGVYHHATVTLPAGGAADLPGFALSLACGLRTEEFSWPLPSPQQPPDALTALVVTVNAPATARAGTTLDYTVTLANDGDTPVGFSTDCPDFHEFLVGLLDEPKDLFALNCAAAHRVPAHGIETFAMELGVPDDAPGGKTQLGWALLAPGRGHDDVPITVVADPSSPTTTAQNGPPPCVAPSGTQPCGPGATIGHGYPYTIDTSCGLSALLFNGEWWSTGLPAGPAPYGWSRLVTGTVTLMKPNGLAAFAGGGHHLDISRPTAQRPPGTTC